MNRQNLYLARHDFVGQSQNELSLRNGDIVDVIETTNNGWWYCQKKDGSAKGFTPGSYLTKVPPQPSYSEVASAAPAAPNTPETTTKGNLSRKGLAEFNARGNRNHHPGNLLAQHEFKDSDMTRNASAPKGDYRRYDGGGHLWGVSDEDQNMNENMNERFGRGKAFRDSHTPRAVIAKPSVTLNLSIREYAKTADQPADLSHWIGFREIPSPAEVFDQGRTEHGTALELTENTVIGPYISKEEYLESHYRLLREDAVAPLRDVVSEIQFYPQLLEKDSENGAYIYEKVFIIGLTFARAGIAARVTFSMKRSGKKVNWEQSKRLLTGSILALTPAKDMFASICHVAIVAARPLAGLKENPPEIDIFFGGADELEIDPQQEWIMVESRNGFYEGSRHTLRGLQMLSRETFPLLEHIVDIQRDIRPPEYLEKQRLMNLSSLFPAAGDEVLNVNILEEWPAGLSSALDTSQMDALRRILTKRLAIVQGPPGTGKTHVSVIALRLLLENLAVGDPPIIISAHTNHALDQLLRHVAKFEPDFIRLGAWTKDIEVVKPRTLFEIKDAVRYSNPTGGMRNPALARLKQLTKAMTLLLAPLTQGKEMLNPKLFEQYNVVSYHQYDSLVKGAKDWIRDEAEGGPLGEIAAWLGDERVEAKYRTMPEDFGIEVEEADLEYEQLKELEAESKLLDDEDHESLRGSRLVFNELFTGRQSNGVTDETVRSEMKKRNLWDVPSEHRGPVYRHMQQALKAAITRQFQELARQYEAASRGARVGLWELDYNYLKQTKVIGMTTTGLSKYRGLIQSLNPRVVLIEEAAETLEAFVSVACFKSLEHLILVGDHQQLRGHCNDQELAGKPYYLGVSMFERLVRNKVEFSQLKRQRRMIPEIRRALKPIYEELEDHPSVLDRLPISGMGGVNSYFFTHQGQETTDDQMSKVNQKEAEMVVKFFGYLALNGMTPAEITVLTFYNGQRKLIMKKLREHPQLQGARFNVVTVDSYQGEENEVVLLSLVRSNVRGNIGFLEVENRVCVALSRARRGFYIFGDAPNLCKSSMLWWHVIQAMVKDPCRVGFYLHLTCTKHNEKTFIKDAEDFDSLDGGCAMPCREELSCGHTCTLSCHPFSHDMVYCKKRCNRRLECGHPCTQLCYLPCKSDCVCGKEFKSANHAEALTGTSRGIHAAPPHYAEDATESSGSKTCPQGSQVGATNYAAVFNGSPERKRTLRDSSQYSGSPPRDIPQDTQPFRDFAGGGHVDSDKNLVALVERKAAEARSRQLDDVNFDALFREAGDKAPVDEIEKMTLVRTISKKDGGNRGLWKGTYRPSRSQDASPSKKEEPSLLDL